MTNMNESFHIWMSHVTYEWCITYEWVMSHMNIWHDALIPDMTHSYVSRMSASCHICHVIYEWFMSPGIESCHVRLSHVAYAWVVSHTRESCRTCEWVMYSERKNSHVTWLIPTSYDLFIREKTHSCVLYVTQSSIL